MTYDPRPDSNQSGLGTPSLRMAQVESDRRAGVVVRATVSRSVDHGFIPLVESYRKTLKNGICSFPAWRTTFMEVVENKPTSSLVASLGKALNGTPHLYVEDR